MQPQKRRSQKASDGAAADYLIAKLGWLRGFPAAGPGAPGLGWVQLPPLGARDRAALVEIDAERIRRTEFGRNRAQAKFPTALPRVVGDPVRWSAAVETQLTLLKAALYERAPWPDLDALLRHQERRRAVRDRARRFAQARPALLNLIVALLWMHWREDRPLVRALAAAERHADLLERIAAAEGGAGSMMTARAAQIAAEGADMRAIAFFAHPYRAQTAKAARTLIEPVRHFLQKIGGGPGAGAADAALPPWPAEDAADATLFLGEVIAALEGLKAPALKRTASLFASVAPIDAAAPWTAWRAQMRRLRRDASDAVAQWRAGRAQMEASPPLENARPFATTLANLHKRLEALEAQTPPPTPGGGRLRELLSAARALSADETPELCDAVLAAVRAQMRPQLAHAERRRPQGDGGATAPQETLLSWRRRLTTFAAGRKVFAPLARLEATLADQDPMGAAASVRGDLIEQAVDIVSFDKPQNRLISPLLETIRLLGAAVLAQQGAAPTEEETARPPRLDLCLARPLLLAGAAPVDVIPILLEIAGWEWGDGVDEAELGQLFALCGQSPEKLGRLLPVWRGRPEGPRTDRALMALAATPDAAAVAVDCALDGEVKRVLRLARHLALGKTLRVTPDAPPHNPPLIDWSRYPGALQPALRALEAADPNAEDAAAAILKADFPTIADLQTERAAIDARLSAGTAPDAEAGLARRRASIDARIAAARTGGAALSPARLRKYERKLARRARHARLRAHEQAAIAALSSALGARLSEAGAPPAWFERIDTLDALAALEDLPKAFASLGWRAARARLGPKPWDFRDAPKNRAYLRGLARRGVSTAPWLDGLPPRPVAGAERPLTLSFEDDPIEILQMGAPFLTCLAPGAFNYFSAVANAIDVNKRVIYARDAEGAVRARCLLALTADGAITSFRLYAHDSHDALMAAVTELVRDLARAMGVAIVRSHAIPTLDAGRWYDDGPVDLTGASALFQDAEALEAWFAERPLAAAPAALRERIGAPILPTHLVALAASPAVRAKPERFAPFASLVGRETALDPETRLSLAQALADAGLRAPALALLNAFTRAAPPRDDYGCPAWRGGRAAEVFLALSAPSRALRALIVSRPMGVRSWMAERDARALAAAQALGALHRRHQAARLLEAVIASPDRHYRAQAKRLLKGVRAES